MKDIFEKKFYIFNYNLPKYFDNIYLLSLINIKNKQILKDNIFFCIN